MFLGNWNFCFELASAEQAGVGRGMGVALHFNMHHVALMSIPHLIKRINQLVSVTHKKVILVHMQNHRSWICIRNCSYTDTITNFQRQITCAFWMSHVGYSRHGAGWKSRGNERHSRGARRREGANCTNYKGKIIMMANNIVWECSEEL